MPGKKACEHWERSFVSKELDAESKIPIVGLADAFVCPLDAKFNLVDMNLLNDSDNLDKSSQKDEFFSYIDIQVSRWQHPVVGRQFCWPVD